MLDSPSSTDRVEEPKAEVTGWMRLLYVIGLIAMVSVTMAIFLNARKFAAHQEYQEEIWGFWGSLDLLAFLLYTSMLLIMLGLVLAISRSRYARFVTLVGVLIVEACLVWAVIKVGDDTSRFQLMAVIAILFGSYLLFHYGLKNPWLIQKFPDDSSDITKTSGWWKERKAKVSTIGWFISVVAIVYFGFFREITVDPARNSTYFLFNMLVVTVWIMMVLLPPSLALLAGSDGD